MNVKVIGSVNNNKSQGYFDYICGVPQGVILGQLRWPFEGRPLFSHVRVIYPISLPWIGVIE